MNPVWDVGQQRFRCEAPNHAKASQSKEVVSPRGDKEFCNSARDNLVKVCPAGSESKNCKGQAKAIFNACYKDSKAESENRTSGSASQGTTDRVTCMQTFAQQQQACQARKLPPPAPGQPSAPDTCLSDAYAAQNKCLANSR
jgi:hypothetical protein